MYLSCIHSKYHILYFWDIIDIMLFWIYYILIQILYILCNMYIIFSMYFYLLYIFKYTYIFTDVIYIYMYIHISHPKDPNSWWVALVDLYAHEKKHL